MPFATVKFTGAAFLDLQFKIAKKILLVNLMMKVLSPSISQLFFIIFDSARCFLFFNSYKSGAETTVIISYSYLFCSTSESCRVFASCSPQFSNVIPTFAAILRYAARKNTSQSLLSLIKYRSESHCLFFSLFTFRCKYILDFTCGQWGVCFIIINMR